MMTDTETKMRPRTGEVNQDTFEQDPREFKFYLTHRPQKESEATAATSPYFRFGARTRDQDTFIEFSEGMSEGIMRFALNFIEEVVRDELTKRTKLLEKENSFLREQLANLPVKRKTQFRLPENFWEEETELV